MSATKLLLCVVVLSFVATHVVAMSEEEELFERLFTEDHSSSSSNEVDDSSSDFDIHAEQPSLSDEEEENNSDDDEHEETKEESNDAASMWHIDDVEEDDSDDHFSFAENNEYADADSMTSPVAPASAANATVVPSNVTVPPTIAPSHPHHHGNKTHKLHEITRHFESDEDAETLKAAVHQADEDALSIVGKLNASSIQLVKATRADVIRARDIYNTTKAVRLEKLTSYQDKINQLRKARATAAEKQRTANAALKECKTTTQRAQKKVSLLTSIANKLKDLHEVRTEVGPSPAVDKQQSKLAHLVADLSESEIDIADLEGEDEPVSYEEKKSRVSTAIKTLQSKNTRRAQKCLKQTLQLRRDAKAAWAAYRILVKPTRQARSVAVKAVRAAAVARQRLISLVRVFKREKAFRHDTRDELQQLSHALPLDSGAVQHRILDLSEKIHDLIIHRVCTVKLSKCAYDVGVLYGKSNKKAHPDFFEGSEEDCPSALKLCRQTLKQALKSSIGE